MEGGLELLWCELRRPRVVYAALDPHLRLVVWLWVTQVKVYSQFEEARGAEHRRPSSSILCVPRRWQRRGAP